MAISLSKGGSISLSKAAGPVPLEKIRVGLGWDPADNGQPYDLDASMLLLDANGGVAQPGDFVFYGNLKHASGAVVHTGDNRDGEGDGDDEVIEVTLPHVPSGVTRLLVLVSIHESSQRKQDFGQISNAFIRVVNLTNDLELARFDLTQGAHGEDCLAFGELYRDGSEWGFSALGDYHSGGLGGALKSYGLDAE